MGMFSDGLGQLGFDTANLTTQGLLMSITGWIATFFFVLLIAGGAAYYLLVLRKYNLKIQVFEDIAGAGWRPTRKDRARRLKIGKGGQEVLYLMKSRVYRTAYGKKMGQNSYWFAIAHDGYWHNVMLKDLSAPKGGELESVHPAMQYQYVALEQTIKDRYDPTTFLQKWGGVMVFTGLCLVIGIVAWLWFKEWSHMTSGFREVANLNIEVLKETEQLIIAIKNACSPSGLVSA